MGDKSGVETTNPSERPKSDASVGTLVCQIVAVPARPFSGGTLSFKCVDGKQSSVDVPAGESLVRLEVAGCFPTTGEGLAGLMTLESPGCALYQRWLSAEDMRGTTTLELRVELEPAWTLSFRVEDEQGRPAEGAVIYAVMKSRSASAGTVRERRVECDRAGRARPTDLSPGKWIVQAAAWKDWGPSWWIQARLEPNTYSAEERVLVVERWNEASYASGRLVAPAEWGGVAYLEDCTFPQRTYPVYGDEFFLRSADGHPISARPVSRTGGLKGTCIEFAPGSHGRQVSVGN